MAISSSAPISPVALVKAGWGSFKQNVGTFLLTTLSSMGIYLASALIYMILLVILGQSNVGMVLMFILAGGLGLAMVGYLTLVQTRLSYLGSAGAHVPLREIMAWNSSLVGRILRVIILMVGILFLAGAAVSLVVILPLALTMLGGGRMAQGLALGVVLVGLAYVAMISLMVFIQVIFSQSLFLALEGKRAVEALKMSVKMTQGSRWRIVGLFLLLGLLPVIVYIPLLLMLMITAVGIADPGLQAFMGILSFLVSLLTLGGLVVVSGVVVFAQGHLFRALAARK
jgi:hypothetical protein